MQGATEWKPGAYTLVCEDLSTGATQQTVAAVGLDNKYNGYTLLELLLVVVCIIIFATRGLYLWHDLTARDKVRSSFDSLARAIEATRILALENDSSFALCASADGVNCNASWRGGLLITDDAQKKISYGSYLYLPCDLIFKGRLIDNKIIFTSSGFTSGIQGRFYCTANSLNKTFSLLVRMNGSVGDVEESNIN